MSLREPSADELERVIAGLYDAALQPGLWPGWQASAARVLGSHTALAAMQDTRTGEVDLLGMHNFNPQAVALYGGDYHKHDLWAQRALARPMTALRSADLCSDEEFARSEIYNELGKPYNDGAFHFVGAVLQVEGHVGSFGFQNPRAAGPFQKRHAEAVQLLVPHLARAMRMRIRLRQAEADRATTLSVLDTVAHGVALVTREARLVHANQAAWALLGKKDGVSLDAKGLFAAAKPGETAALRRLIDECTVPAGGGGVARLTRPSGKRPFEVLVAPLGARGRDDTSHRAVAMVFLRDPEAKPRPVPALLRELYRLTPGEARLAADLLADRSLLEIAEARRLSRETLRTQLKALFLKTGTNRQSELIGFLATGLAVVLRDGGAGGSG